MGPEIEVSPEDSSEPPDEKKAEEIQEDSSQVKVSELPINLEQSVILVHGQDDIAIHLQYAKFPKPVWPKSPVTIPSSFFRDVNRRVELKFFKVFVLENVIFFQYVQLNTDGMVTAAPVLRRPYDSMTNPYSPSCSRLCNHPVSKDIKREYKDAMKKVKDTHVS